LPNIGVTSIGETCPASSEDITPPSSLVRTHAPIPCDSPLLRLLPRSSSLCRLLPASAANGIFPTLSLPVLPKMPGPLPRRLAGCTYLLLRPQHRPSPKELWVGIPCYSAQATSQRRGFSRLQSFLYVQASQFARHPGRSHHHSFTAGQSVTSTSEPVMLRYLRMPRIC
jgi:hypothetical protein